MGFVNQGNYFCLCGREFKNSQSFNGHKGHCKEYLGEEKYLQNKEKLKQSSIIAGQTQSNNKQLKKQQKLEQWISEKNQCEKCQKIMILYYGSGRFCSKECAKSVANYKGKNNKIINYDNSYKIQCEYCERKFIKQSDYVCHLKYSHYNEYLEYKIKVSNKYICLKTGVLNITKNELKNIEKNNNFVKYVEKH